MENCFALFVERLYILSAIWRNERFHHAHLFSGQIGQRSPDRARIEALNSNARLYRGHRIALAAVANLHEGIEKVLEKLFALRAFAGAQRAIEIIR